MSFPTKKSKQVSVKQAKLSYEYILNTLRDFHNFIYNGQEIPPYNEEAILSFVKCLEDLEMFLINPSDIAVGRQSLYSKVWADKFLKGFCLNPEYINLRDSEGSYLTLTSYQVPFMSIDPHKCSNTVKANARKLGLPVAVCYDTSCYISL